MEEQIYQDKVWLVKQKYPKGTKFYFALMITITLILLLVLFFYHYSVYQTFYGIVEEDKNSILKIMLPLTEIKEFEKAVEENKKIELKKIDSDIDFVSGQNIVFAYIKVDISKKLLVKNNIVPIKLKLKSFTFWEEMKQKWKEGIKK